MSASKKIPDEKKEVLFFSENLSFFAKHYFLIQTRWVKK